MPKRGKGFSKVEVDYLLESCEEILPIGPDAWDRVVERHILLYPNLDAKDSLRKKIASLYNSTKPTGDPKCPGNVRKAKKIPYFTESCAPQMYIFFQRGHSNT